MINEELKQIQDLEFYLDSSIDVTTFPIPIRLRFEPIYAEQIGYPCIRCTVTLVTPPRPPEYGERYLGRAPQENIRVGSTLIIPLLLGREGAVEHVKRGIIEALRHELDEHFMVEGKRLYDPHRREYAHVPIK